MGCMGEISGRSIRDRKCLGIPRLSRVSLEHVCMYLFLISCSQLSSVRDRVFTSTCVIKNDNKCSDESIRQALGNCRCYAILEMTAMNWSELLEAGIMERCQYTIVW